jgi:hypothetical protein
MGDEARRVVKELIRRLVDSSEQARRQTRHAGETSPRESGVAFGLAVAALATSRPG